MASERFMRHHYGASGFVSQEPSVERPEYRKIEEGKGGATKTFMIVCNEGWRESIVCNSMYEWAADWLVEVLQGKPFASKAIPHAKP